MDIRWRQLRRKFSGIRDLTSVGFADVIGTGIAGIFWFYLATLIDAGQYGEINYFLGIASLAQILCLYGNQNTITVYIAKNIKIQTTFYLISLIAGSISTILIFGIFHRVDSAVLVFGYIISVLAIATLLGKKLYSKYSKYVLIQKVLTLILGIGFYFNFGVDGIIYALALSHIPFALIIFQEFRETTVDFSLLKSRLGFTTNNYMMSLASGLNGKLDKLIIAPLLGFTILGNYALALQFYIIMMIFSTVVFKFILPQDASGNSNKRLKIITILVAFGIAVLGTTLLPFLIPHVFSKFTDVVDAIKIMSLAVIPATLVLIFQSKFLGYEKSKYVLLGSISSLVVMIIGIIILGTLFGIIGLATTFVIASVTEAIFLLSTNHLIKSR